MTAGSRLTTTAVAFLLASLLGPESFGTVALATLYVLLAQALFQQGFAPAIIARRDLTDAYLQLAFRLVVCGSILVTGATWILSGALASVFSDDGIAPVIRVLSFILPVAAVGLVPDSLLRRSSDFRSMASRSNIAVLVGGVAGVVLGLRGAGVWALVAQQGLTTLMSTLLTFRRVKWRPEVAWPWKDLSTPDARELLRYACSISVSTVTGFGAAQTDSLVVGAYYGVAPVGLYRLAQRLVDTVLDLGVRTVQVPALSDMARSEREGVDLADRFLILQRGACGLTLPALGVMAATGLPFLRLLGPDWAAAGIPLLLLAAAGVTTAVVALATPALQSAGRPLVLVTLNGGIAALSAIIFLATAVALEGEGRIREQLLSMASARLALGLFVLVPVHALILRRIIGVSLSRFAASCLPGLTACAAAACIGLLVHYQISAAWTPVFDLLVTTAVAATSGLGTICTVEPSIRAGVRRNAIRIWNTARL